MKIYFAVSIRGGREMVEMCEKFLKEISVYGTVLTEHVAKKSLSHLEAFQNSALLLAKENKNWKHLECRQGMVCIPPEGVSEEVYALISKKFGILAK